MRKEKVLSYTWEDIWKEEKKDSINKDAFCGFDSLKKEFNNLKNRLNNNYSILSLAKKAINENSKLQRVQMG